MTAAKVEEPEYGADDGRDDIVDPGFDDAAARSADDDTNCEIYDVETRDK